MLDHYAFQLKVLENSVRETLRAQCMDESSPFYGALEETVQGVTGPHASIALTRRLIEGCCVPGNTFCGREDLLERAALAMEYALTRVHEDGTIDLVTTNLCSHLKSLRMCLMKSVRCMIVRLTIRTEQLIGQSRQMPSF